MKRAIHYTQLGGTLFVPASHKNITPILQREKYPELRSVVIDFEDGLDPKKLQNTTGNLQNILQSISEKSPFIFIRSKDEKHLESILKIQNIEKIDGLVLAKFSLTNCEQYMQLLQSTDFYIMPSIEGFELFDYVKLQELKQCILTYKQKVLLVRFGLEDMLKQLSMKRTCNESVFDLAVGNAVLGNFIGIFKSAGFAVSGGVYPCFEDEAGFLCDLKRDLKEGLFSKTIIHPKQIALVNELYKVSKKEYDEATEILNASDAVFNQEGKMAETKTMANYAEFIKKRSEVYGIEP